MQQIFSFARSSGVPNESAELGEHDYLTLILEVHKNAQQVFSFAGSWGVANDTAEFEEPH